MPPLGVGDPLPIAAVHTQLVRHGNPRGGVVIGIGVAGAQLGQDRLQRQAAMVDAAGVRQLPGDGPEAVQRLIAAMPAQAVQREPDGIGVDATATGVDHGAAQDHDSQMYDDSVRAGHGPPCGTFCEHPASGLIGRDVYRAEGPPSG